MAKKTLTISIAVQDGQGGVRKLTAQAEDLRKVLNGTVTNATGLKKSLKDLGGMSFGIDAIVNSLNTVQNALASSVEAYNVQIEAETKLETVMRKRMAATEEEIQSIKDLCSAQQQLGIIGDEVQLAGAQQISTFLTQKAALEVLIPAMNNLVAQQKGLNATSGDAVNIGNLLGKAMQGQTSALRRVGITFSETEEKAVKFGTEEERAAALAKIITNNVGEMNSALAKTPTGAAKQMANNLGDIQEKIGGVVKDFMPAITAVNQFVMAWGNIKKLQQTLSLLPNTIRRATKSISECDIQVKILNKSFVATGVGAKALAVTFKASMAIMKTALISTGIGIALWGIGEAIAFVTNKLNGLDSSAKGAGESLNSLTEEQTELNRVQNDAKAKLTLHIAEIHNFTGTKEEERKKVEELNQTYGASMGTMSSLSEWYKTLTDQSELYCKQMVLQARAQMLAKKIAEGQTLKYNINKNQKKFNKQNQNSDNPLIKTANESMNKTSSIISRGIEEGINTLQEEFDDVVQEISDIGKKLKVKATAIPDNDPTTTKSVKTKENTPAPSGSIADYKKQISDIETKISLEPDPANAAVLQMEKAKIEEALSKLLFVIDFRFRYGNDLEARRAEIESMPITAPLKVVVDEKELNATLGSIPRIVKEGTQSVTKLNKALNGISQVGTEVGNVFNSLGEAFGSPVLNIAAIIAGAVANIMAGYAAAAGKAGGETSSPWEWIAFAVSGLATAVAAVASIKQATAFANGGIVSGPTMALVGEYAGASNNPEVIAPLDKLRKLIGSPAGAQPVIIGGDVKVKGSDIVIALRNQLNVSRVTGRGLI